MTNPMGVIYVPVVVSNVLHPEQRLELSGRIDTGAFGLVLPKAWKARLGPFLNETTAEVELADGRPALAELCGPVSIQLGTFRPITNEVVFVDTEQDAGFEPLIGYTVLELARVMIDMVSHRLLARPRIDLKAVA